MSATEKIYTPNRWVALQLYVWMLFICAAVYASSYLPWRRHAPSPLVNISVLGVFLLLILFASRSVLSMVFKNKAIVLTPAGLTDYTIPLGFIPWQEVTAFEAKKIKYGRHTMDIIEIHLRNEEVYLEKLKSPTAYVNRRKEGHCAFYLCLGEFNSKETLLQDLETCWKTNRIQHLH